MSARPALRLVLPLALLATAAVGCSGPPPPHVFFITADTLRADHLSSSGYGRPTTPNLDAFAEGAWNFRQAVTVIPKTGPSFTTYFTGRHPQEHGVRFNFTKIPTELPVLAERMRGAGYATHAFVGNTVLRESKGYARGFDSYEHVMDGDTVKKVNRAFLEFADGHDWSEPTFVWIHYLDPHGPYEPPKRHEKRFLDDGFEPRGTRVSLDWESVMEPEDASPNKILGALPKYQQRDDGEDRIDVFVARYDAEIRYADEAFGAVLERLRELGQFDPSWILFTSDHGESLGEHDFYFEHGWYAYEPTLHVPLIVKEPGQLEGGNVERLVSNLDLLPTLCARIPGLGFVDGPGRDLFAEPDLGADEELGHLVVIESSDSYPEKYHGLRGARWKFLVRESDGRVELYDLEADPGETRNLAEDEPALAGQLQALLEQRLHALRARAFAPGSEDGEAEDPEMLERLKALGYTR